MALDETGSISLKQLIREKSCVFAGGRHFFLDNSTYVFLMSPHEPTGGVGQYWDGAGPYRSDFVSRHSRVVDRRDEG